MALKYELEQWGAAVEAYDSEEFDKALEIFETIADSAKFHFNMGLIHATLGEHEEACRQYKKAVKLDQFFAVAYFQKGVSHFLLGEFEKALQNFNDSLLYLRKNMLIDYEQLGLKFRLYSCEILFNRGLCYLYLGKTEQGMGDFSSSQKEKQTEEHDVIDEAIAVQGQGFTVFSIPVGVIYRPPEGKLKNVKTKDYLGKAKLVAAVDPEDAYTGFSGAQQQKKQQQNTTTPITKANTEGTVIQLNGSESRSTSPEPSRPRSLSTNAREPPFPTTKTARNPSLRRRPTQNEGIPSNLPYVEENKVSNGFSPGGRSPALEDRPTRMNSLRNPNRPTLKDGPTRSNSLRDSPPSRSNSLRGGPPRMNSIRGRGTGRPVPQRSNTQGRTQFLQQQMQKMSVSDDDQAYNDYYQNGDQFANNNPTSPPLMNEDYSNQVYDFILGGDPYYNEGNEFNSPVFNNGNNNSNRNPGQPPMSPIRSPSLRGRGASSPGRAMGFKPSPLSLQGGLITPPTDNGEDNYASLIFDDDGYGYGDDDETKFEMLPAPQKHISVQHAYAEPLQKPTKIKIKCYAKDTRVIMVSASIKYPDLIKRIQEKFSTDKSLQLKYKDEDGTKVTMIDQDDLEMAVSMVPDVVSDPGRMEIWLEAE